MEEEHFEIPDLPDMSQPREDWHQCDHPDLGTIYLPRGLSWNGPARQFRVYANDKLRGYFSKLEAAWVALCEVRDPKLLLKGIQMPSPKGRKKRIETGVIGVRIKIENRWKHKGGTNYSVSIVVLQKIQGKHRTVCAGTKLVQELTQRWLDRTLCLGAAMRWRWFQLLVNEPESLTEPIRPNDVPIGMIPRRPVLRVTVKQIENAVKIDRGH